MNELLKNRDLARTIATLNHKYNYWPIEKVAKETKLSVYTIKSFLRGKRNCNRLIIYYTSKMLWDLMHSEYVLSEKAGVDPVEVQSDRQNLITILSMVY